MVDEPKLKGALPAISSSFRVHAGVVDEITWTSENDVLRFCGYHQSDYLIRGQLRALGRQGIIVHRRHPEHGFYEYGPQWRRKDFALMVDASIAAGMLSSRPEDS